MSAVDEPHPLIIEAGDALKQLREDAEMSQEDFGPLVLLSASHLSKVERGRLALKPFQIDELEKKYPAEARRIRALIARAKGWSKDEPGEEPHPQRRDGYVPLVGRAACGKWIAALERGVDELAGERSWIFVGRNAKPRTFVIEAAGDSMTGPTGRGETIDDGDYLLVDPDAPLANGHVALVRKGSHEVTVKIWREIDDKIVLTPTNPKHKEEILARAKFGREGGTAYRITRVIKMKDI